MGCRWVLPVAGLCLILLALAAFESRGQNLTIREPEAGMAVSMIVPQGEALNYWPRWRGPTGQGIVAGKGYPDTWSSVENVLWKVDVPGRGHSSPIIWGDKLFLTTADIEGKERSVLCFRRTDGKLLWQTPVPEAAAEVLHAKNSFASSTPVTDGTRVYAYFGNAGLVAVDFEGKVIWHTSFGPVRLEHGPGGSPLLYKDRIILYQEQITMSRSNPAEPGFIVAVEKDTGKILWREPRKLQMGYGTPLAIQAGNRVEIIVSSAPRVEAYDPDTGRIFWYCTGNTIWVVPTPVVGHGMIFATSGRAGPTIAIRPGGEGDVTDSRVVWRATKGSPLVPSALLLEDHIYVVNDMTSIASAYNALSGELVGQIRLGEARSEGFTASPIAVNNKLFFTNDEGETFVLQPAPDFKLLHVNQLGAQTLASPALVDGKWYFRAANQLICIGRN
jgi:outer membrane protein assembly factor BamB